ncbi:hypothetical protein Cgig2_008581 [Carnegiea gigantea]|uniref:DUF4283 domain-containing protein n=1 Tax=Carnegiea gigantea TaxID=171969 RepID=A0A9Q1JFU9_9CARY|nr:hypothetical protein Cgig2_000601 [Carnegiea gigantea]KAJ8423962.1 hypothetical protein Cgig2_008581 [Carnegiea gigantea]
MLVQRGAHEPEIGYERAQSGSERVHPSKLTSGSSLGRGRSGYGGSKEERMREKVEEEEDEIGLENKAEGASFGFEGPPARLFLAPLLRKLTVTGLEEAWQNLKLIADEEQVIVVEEDDNATTDELISLCLLGRLHASNSFNPRAMKSVLRNVWKPTKGLVIRDLDSNLFTFQFFSAADRDFVLNEGPWAFDGCILLLKQMTGLEVPSKAEFRLAPYDVPGKKLTTSFAQFLTSNIGDFVSCEDTTMFRVDQALCFRVDIDMSKPLRREIYIKATNKQLWIRFKYIKLPDFRYGCSKLGHVLVGCDFVQVSKGDDDLQYGIWLCASPLKS